MTARSIPRVIVIGASAGGVPALLAVVSRLPAELEAAVFVVLHVPPDARSELPRVLSSHGLLRATQPVDGESIEVGRIYVARPDHHLLVDGDRIGVKRGPRENRFRPSIDALFRSAAYTHRERTVGVVLSGALDDGTAGLWTIKRFGGLSVIQAPNEAQYDSMPLNAREQVEIDYELPAAEIGPLLVRLCAEPPPAATSPANDLRRQVGIEVAVASSTNAFRKGIMEVAELTPYTCPECHGALVKLTQGSITRYRCHTGHAYSKSALLAGITDAVDESLWQVTRALEESVMLLDEIAGDLKRSGRDEEAGRVALEARRTEKRGQALQALAIAHEHLSEEALRAPPASERT